MFFPFVSNKCFMHAHNYNNIYIYIYKRFLPIDAILFYRLKKRFPPFKRFN